MIKWLAALKYNTGESPENCRRYWTERHSRLALAVGGLRHYVQSHRVSGGEDIGNAPYDGFESFWFDDEVIATQALASSQMMALRADMTQFAESSGTRQFLAREVVMRDAPTDADSLKLVTFNFRKAGLSPQLFQDYWEHKHGPLVLRHFAALRRYVQNHALLASYSAASEPDFDGVLEAWLASFEALSGGEGTPEHATVRADEINFLDPDRFRFMLVRDRTFR